MPTKQNRPKVQQPVVTLERLVAGPMKYGTTEVDKGTKVPIPAGVARQLLEGDPKGWKLVEGDIDAKPVVAGAASTNPEPSADAGGDSKTRAKTRGK